MGLLVIYKIIDLHYYLLMTLDGNILRGLWKYERLKPSVIRTNKGNVSSLPQLKQVSNIGIRVGM